MKKRLNDEQRKIVEDNHNLIYAFLSSNSLDIEEYYDLAAIGICKAALSYDKEKGQFSTLAYKCMWNQVMVEKRKQKAISRGDGLQVLYYDACFESDDSEISFLEMLEDWKADTGKQAEIRHFLYSIYSKLNELESKMFDLLLRGYKQKEVAILCGRSQTTVGNLRKRLKNLYNSSERW